MATERILSNKIRELSELPSAHQSLVERLTSEEAVEAAADRFHDETRDAGLMVGEISNACMAVALKAALTSIQREIDSNPLRERCRREPSDG